MRASTPSLKASQVWDHWYDWAKTLVDDLPDVTATGTMTAPDQLIDNDTTLDSRGNGIGEYVEIDFAGPTYIESMRHFGYVGENEDGVMKLQAYIEGSWVDVLTGISTRGTADWSAWLPLTIPSTAILWRFTIVTVDTYVAGCIIEEAEFLGVRLG